MCKTPIAYLRQLDRNNIFLLTLPFDGKPQIERPRG